MLILIIIIILILLIIIIVIMICTLACLIACADGKTAASPLVPAFSPTRNTSKMSFQF